EHFIDLCRMLGHPTPAEADPEGRRFTFEAGATKQRGGQGWADVWKKGYFAWEYKGKHADLDRAYQQLLQYREALEIIMDVLPLPGVIGRICPHPCETVCRRAEIDEAVAIRDLKRLAADRFDPREIELQCQPQRKERVAIIGSGPAGLAAGYHLARQGVLSTIFERLPEPGGMLRVGIPEYRLPRRILDREIEVITNLGVAIKTNAGLGNGVTIDGLFKQGYGAVYLALGAHEGMKLGIPGEEAEGVCQGVDLLRQINLTGTVSVGQRVAIVGGGNVAIDVARSALRLGAEKVTIVYRRTAAEMPAWEPEVEAAEAEGVEVRYLTAPVEVLSRGGRVVGLRCLRMTLGEPDASGRKRPVPVPGSEYDIALDQVVEAIGQRPALAEAMEGPGATSGGIHVHGKGTIQVDPMTYETNRRGVFAGGDVQTGPGIAIEAIAAGREAAESIIRYLDGRSLIQGRESRNIEEPAYRQIPRDTPKQARVAVPELPVGEREKSFKEVSLGYDEKAGEAEAGRCLNCGYCCECFQCVTACQAEAVTLETHRQQPETDQISVGAVVLATGFQPYDPAESETYGYGKHPNVVSSMEFERILSASGPTQGVLLRPSDQKPPRKIAWMQCVGSRNIHEGDRGYCSSVCCMYAIKEAVIAKEHTHADLECAIFFMDMRTQGKGFEQYYTEASARHGIRFIRCRPHTMDSVPGSEDVHIRYVTENGKFQEETFDMVVLSVGLEISAETVELAERLGLELTRDRFCEGHPFCPVLSSREGIYVCGAFQGPMDIPESVTSASAAADLAMERLAGARNTLVRPYGQDYPVEKDIHGQHPRIGVFVCH
ncbi:MAG: FAD-dependent oxidoreductase, partial [Syntrophobacteria bacterium]